MSAYLSRSVVLRRFWDPAALERTCARVLETPGPRLQRGSPTMRELAAWSRTDDSALWDACLARLPAGRVEAPYVVRYQTGVELLQHRDSGCHRLVALARKAEAGGDLFLERRHVPLEVGDAILFDDSRLHEISRVVSGERWTLTLGTDPRLSR